MSSTNTKEWKGLSKGVNAEGTKGYHAGGWRRMTILQNIRPFALRLPRSKKKLQTFSVGSPDCAFNKSGFSRGLAHSRFS
ncbi:hypothetical protein [Pseudomonas sp.]|uniref:hypothetical protein n=1 Tax=Pseudomonas sp. TaxID=306 RepID=UPI003F393903